MYGEDIFSPYQLTINTPEGQNLFKYEFVQFGLNEHLMSGIFSALDVLYGELFGEEPDFIQMGRIKISISRIRNILVCLFYEGADDLADIFMCEIFDKISQHNLFNDLNNSLQNNPTIIPVKVVSRIESLIKNHQNVEFEINEGVSFNSFFK